MLTSTPSVRLALVRPWLVALLAGLTAALLLASCSSLNTGTQPAPGQQPDHTADITSDTTVTGANGASAVIPAGTTVTSNSITNGQASFNSEAVPASVQQNFTGQADLYGSVGFAPLDAAFSQPVSIKVPAGSADGTVNVYRYNNSTTSAVAGWTLIGSGTPAGGTVTVSTDRFGYFVAGNEIAASMPEAAVAVPSGMTNGENATWSASWTGGEGPYTIEWNFGGGANPNTASANNATSPASQQAAMVNTGTAAANYTYTVTVTDSHGNGDTATGSYSVAPSSPAETFTLTLFHNNDGESQLVDAGNEELPDGGNLSSFGGAAHFVTKLGDLRDEAAAWADATVTVSSGDNFLAGAEFNASQTAGVYYDALVLEAIGYDAICLGNHDFDFGPDVLAEFIDSFEAEPSYVSCNLDFSGEASLQALVGERIFPSVTVTKAGHQIGIVGATTEELPFISSPRGVSQECNLRNVSTLDARSNIQAQIDALENAGVDIIILISHLQSVTEDEELLATLSGVDIAVAGGGDELLTGAGAENLIPGDEPVEGQAYPLLVNDADGQSVPVVTTPGNYKYVGMLTVEFDADGEVVSVVDGHSGLQRVANSNYADAVAADATLQSDVITPVETALTALASNVIGTTEVPLNGRRGSWDEVNGVPATVGIRNSETNLGNLDADALLWQANQLAESFGAPLAQVALQNGGGMRNDAVIPAGNITELDTFAINAFPNFVTILAGLPHQSLRNVIEGAVSRVQATNGGFMQVAGLRFEYDPTGTPYDYATPGSGTRLRNLWLTDGTQIVSDGIVLHPDATVNVATIDFLARGGDGTPFTGYDELYTLGVSYQQALKNYIVAGLDGEIKAEMYPYEGEDGEGNPLAGERRIMTIHDGGFALSHIGTYDSGLGEGSTEIVTYDHATLRLFSTNAEDESISVIDFSDPANPAGIGQSIDVSSYGHPTSCCAKNGILAVAVANANEQANGLVNLYDTASMELISSSEAGALPDMVAFTPDGTRVLAANEGQPSEDYTVDPEGSVTVLDISADPADPVVTTIAFTSLNAQEADLRAAGVRVFGIKQPGDVPSTLAEDLEPEYIAVEPDNSTAIVICQENNALVIIDLDELAIDDVMPLGTKDWSTGPMLDASDRDGADDGPAINMQNWPVESFYMPDAISAFCVGGEVYVVSANEGDARDYYSYSEEARCKDLTLDAAVFPNAATLQEDASIGRMKVTLANGDTDGDGDYDIIYGYGARSFSIWGNSGLVWDSGDDFESFIAANYPALFNMNEGQAADWDDRSDDKGPEPEGIATGSYRGTKFAFIALERQGGMFTYDVSVPASPVMLGYSTTDTVGDGTDAAPEGVLFISADQSPTGKPLVLYSTEVAGTIVVWELTES